MHKLFKLKPGDLVEIIAPASRCSEADLNEMKNLFSTWQLNCKIADTLFGDDLLCANTDTARFNALKNALLDPESRAVICARGGYGSARLIAELDKVSPSDSPKLFIGMSDITALNLFLQQKWQWPVIHGAIAPGRFSPESITAMQALLLGETKEVEFSGLPLNKAAEKELIIENSVVTGGNLSLLQTSIGTKWQLDSCNKIIFIEEAGERGYRIDRMLEHLRQAHIFDTAKAIVLGDFTGGAEPNGNSLIKPVLTRFAQTLEIPVIKIEGVGHDSINFPLPLGTEAKLMLGSKASLKCSYP
jgi:muramoyltetrapeptide carboxypeptidase